jgi:hypothetical protein
LAYPSIWIDARGTEAELKAKPIADRDTVKSVIQKFKAKYRAREVKKYYSTFDAAVAIDVH